MQPLRERDRLARWGSRGPGPQDAGQRPVPAPPDIQNSRQVLPPPPPPYRSTAPSSKRFFSLCSPHPGDVRTSISSVHSADNSPKGAPVSKIADALPSKTSAPISPATLVSELSATAGDTSSSSAIQFENPFAIPARVEGSNGRSAPLGLEVVQEAPVGEEVVAPRPPPPPTTQEAASEPAERNGGGEVHPFPSKGGPTHLETLESLDKMNKKCVVLLLPFFFFPSLR